VGDELKQGEPWSIDDSEPRGSEPGYRRPWLVVQNNRTNATAIRTVLMCPLTTNLRLALAPGNVRLRHGEAGLLRESAVVVSGLIARDRQDLDQRVGELSRARLAGVLSGIALLLDPSEAL
jgi:mRNA interferase MazF